MLTLVNVCGQVQQPGDNPPLSPAALVSALDEQLQLRFLDPRLGFGMSRLCGPDDHPVLHQATQQLRRLPQPDNPTWRNPKCGTDWAPFHPRNSQEAWVDGEVRRAKVEVWTLLVGEKVRSLEGPVVLGNKAPANLDDVRRQLLSRVARSPISQAPLDGWQVIVKPIKASRDSCLGCHNPRKHEFGMPRQIPGLKLGDPIGFLVYLFRQRP